MRCSHPKLDLKFTSLVSKNFLRNEGNTSFWSKISAIHVSAIDTDVDYGPPDIVHIIGVYSDSSTARFGANAGLVWNASLVRELIGAS